MATKIQQAEQAAILLRIPERGRLQRVTYNGRTDWETGIAKAWAEEHGFAGLQGGWIYTLQGRPYVQGWFAFWQIKRVQILNWLTAELTAFKTFDALINAEGGYRPTILVRGRGAWKFEALAEAYDQAQRGRGDARRAHRGTSYLKVGRDYYLSLFSDRRDIKDEHLVDGEREAAKVAVCGAPVEEVFGDLTRGSFRYVTCAACKVAAGLA